MTAAPQAPPRFEVLDAWRGIAALAVVIRHINGSAWFLTGPLHGNLGRAVDFFFVLSGFVIAMRYGEPLARGFSLARYMLLRWGRVWPLHAAMVICYLALELVLLAADGAGMSGRAPFTGPRDPVALPVSLFLMQAWILPGQDVWNTQSWSVSVELGLYLGAALLWRACGHAGNWLGAAAAIALLLGALLWLPWPGNVLRGAAGFGLGMGCWALWPLVRDLRVPVWMTTALELALPVLALTVVAWEMPLIVPDLLFAALVLVFAREGGPVSRLLRTGPARWLGVLSYAIYMVHGLIIGRVFDILSFVQSRIGAQWVAAQLGGEDRLLLAPLPALLVVLGILVAVVAAAWLAWRFVEWPARGLSRRLLGERGAIANSPT